MTKKPAKTYILRMAKLKVQNTEISIIKEGNQDYISLTDMKPRNAKERNRAADIIKNWLQKQIYLEFIGTWEQINNLILKWSNLTTLKCKLVASFVISASEWIEKPMPLELL